MAIDRARAAAYVAGVLGDRDPAGLRQRLAPRTDAPPPPLPPASEATPELVDARWAVLGAEAATRAALADPASLDAMGAYAANIEHFIGTVKVPVGVAGPLRVNGLHAHGDYYVPLATTEAALVASYGRGARTLTEAGGASAMVLAEGVSRAPGFVFRTLGEAGQFVAWCLGQDAAIRAAADATTRHGRLVDTAVTVEGNHVYLGFVYETGDASGQNMATLATEAACAWLVAHAPVAPVRWYVEANLSGDKKASALSLLSVRGRKVTAEATLPAALVERRLKSTPAAMEQYWRVSAMGGALSGTLGVQGHYANALAALYLACGQDVATVSESAVGLTRLERTDDGDLYAAVTLPNVIVGTVGGGTGLPSQRACLDLLGLRGDGHARALAELVAALALAGELSIIAALAAGHFASAHRRYARERGQPPGSA